MSMLLVFGQTPRIVAAGLGSPYVQLPQPIRAVLAQRRADLSRLATSALLPRRTAGLVGVGGVQPQLFQVLEGLNAVLVDEALVSRSALRNAGATIIDDRVVPLVSPWASAPPHARQWHLATINVDAARRKNLTGAGVLIGVLDTGIDTNHLEFAGKTIWFAEFDGSGTRTANTSRDTHYHGTHVSGLLAGSTVGVAPGADLAVAAVLTASVGGVQQGRLAQIAAGFDWLITNSFRGDRGNVGVDVINASLGMAPYNDFLLQAVENAAALGTLVVAAIGNQGASGCGHDGSPGNYTPVLAAGATDQGDRVASFSDWGINPSGVRKPDIVAPGVGVVSSVSNSNPLAVNTDYAALDGTSMASPIVCGAAALCLQQDWNLRDSSRALSGRVLGLVRGWTAPDPHRGVLPVDAIHPRGGAGILDLTGI